MPKPPYPSKLMVLDPVYAVDGYRRRLAALEATLIVEQTIDGRFTFNLRDTRKLGPRSYVQCLVDLTANLNAGYVLALVEPDEFFEDLEDLAREHAPAAQIAEIEAATFTIAERSHQQVRDLLEGDVHFSMGRCLVAATPRARGRPCRSYHDDELNVIAGIRTPRTEQFWNSLRSEWLDVRRAQHAQAAWQRWARRGRRSTIIKPIP